MSTIAVVLALGGGYALAVSGNSPLQKAGIDGLPTSFKKVLKLTGFGKIQARCDTADDDVDVRFISKKGTWTVFGDSNVSSQLVNLSVAPGETDNIFDVAALGAGEYFDLHISKNAADSKAQANLMIKGVGPSAIDGCDTTQLRVLAVNTQQ